MAVLLIYKFIYLFLSLPPPLLTFFSLVTVTCNALAPSLVSYRICLNECLGFSKNVMAPPATTMAQVVIYSEDMTDAMRAFAIEITQAAFLMTVAKGHVYSSIAAKIRDEFDQAYNGIGWNCVVGKDFGSSVTHEIKTYMYVHRTKPNTLP
jgi:dynein light chain LC8-type